MYDMGVGEPDDTGKGHPWGVAMVCARGGGSGAGRLRKLCYFGPCSRIQLNMCVTPAASRVRNRARRRALD